MEIMLNFDNQYFRNMKYKVFEDIISPERMRKYMQACNDDGRMWKNHVRVK